MMRQGLSRFGQTRAGGLKAFDLKEKRPKAIGKRLAMPVWNRAGLAG